MNIKNSSVQPVGATLAVARPLQGASRQMRATARVAPTPCCPIIYLKFISRGLFITREILKSHCRTEIDKHCEFTDIQELHKE